MEFLSLLPGILFACAGLYAIYFLLRALLSPLLQQTTLFKNLNPLKNLKERSLKKKEQQLLTLKEQFEEQEYSRCANLLGEVLFIDPPLISIKFLDQVSEHNFQVLAFLLYVSKNASARIALLPELERLVQARSSLHRSLAEGYLSLEELKKKRRSEGKKTPKWALDEFENKIEELEKELEENKKDILAAVKVIAKTIVSTKAASDSVHYH